MRRTRASGDVDYQALRDNSVWPDHVARTYVTAGLAAWTNPHTIVDPATGDGSIPLAIRSLVGVDKIIFGDISEANIKSIVPIYCMPADEAYVGHASTTLGKVQKADLCILTEILEHIAAPESLLRQARLNSDTLIASSPLIPQHLYDDNYEHLWMFDENEYREMLVSTGWKPDATVILSFTDYPYTFQIWRAH